MVVQVIIYVGDQDGKSNAPPKLFDIGLDRGSMQSQCVNDFRVEVFLGGVPFDAEERGSRHIHQAPAVCSPIETSDQCHRHPVAIHQPRCGRVDSSLLGKLHRRHGRHDSVDDGIEKRRVLAAVGMRRDPVDTQSNLPVG